MLVLVSSVRRFILFRFRKRTADRHSREVRISALPFRQQLKKLSQKTQKLFLPFWHQTQLTLRRLWANGPLLIKKPSARKILHFSRHYSAQLGFTAMVIVFLMITVGEGQAFDPSATTRLAASLQGQNQADGFFGKPQLFSDQTVSTGEVQQQAAIVYQVAPGDSVVSIAERYNLSPGTILDANHLKATDANKITPGQQLLVPATDTNTSLAWLDAINKAEAEERAKAEAARQKQLAAQQRQLANNNTSSRSTASAPSGSNAVTVLGRKIGSYNGGLPGYCTWQVHDVRKDLPSGMGNAINYIASARAHGLATGSVARANAVMVSRESPVGHVAVVQQVYSDGSFKIIEMNYVSWGTINTRIVRPGNVPVVGFVY